MNVVAFLELDDGVVAPAVAAVNFTDGTFAYYVPGGDDAAMGCGLRLRCYGYVARVSLSDFSSSGISYLSLADTNANLSGFEGGFTDGTFAYYVPHNNGAYHGYVARVRVTPHTQGVGWSSSP